MCMQIHVYLCMCLHISVRDFDVDTVMTLKSGMCSVLSTLEPALTLQRLLGYPHHGIMFSSSAA